MLCSVSLYGYLKEELAGAALSVKIALSFPVIAFDFRLSGYP